MIKASTSTTPIPVFRVVNEPHDSPVVRSLRALTTVDDLLLVSTGHKKTSSGWVGHSPFHVYHEKREVGVGDYRYGFIGLGDDRRTTEYRMSVSDRYDWRWEDGYLERDSAVDYHLPYPIPDFSTFALSLNDFGTRGIRRTRPGNPLASLGQFLVELRDLPRLPELLFHRASILKAAGSDYLNYEFGWKPFIQDMRKLYRAQRIMDKRLSQLIRDNGLPVRRHFEEKAPIEHEEMYVGSSATSTHGQWLGNFWDVFGTDSLPYPPEDWDFFNDLYLTVGDYPYVVGPSEWPGSAHVKWVRNTSTVTRFCCTYKYYIPDIGSSQWTRKAVGALYGAELTPALLWELIPWSWLIDWFSNVGDILSNVSANAVDHEVLDNCYVSRTIVQDDIVDVSASWEDFTHLETGLQFFAGGDKVTYSRQRVHKLRQPSSPFAFGSSWDGWHSFTARQLALLAALGLTRALP